MRKLLVLVMLLTAFTSAYADLTVISKGTDGTEEIQYFANNKAATYTDGQIDALVDVKTSTITMFMHEQSAYMTMTAKELEDRMKMAQKMMDQSMDNPQAKAYMDAMKQKMKNMKVTMKKTGTKKIAGYSCVEYVLEVKNQDSNATVCVSKEVMDLVEKDFNAKKLSSMLKSNLAGDNGIENPIDKEVEKLEQEGFPLFEKTVINSMGMTETDSMTVVEINKNKISSNIFAVPAGYKKKTMAELMGGE